MPKRLFSYLLPVGGVLVLVGVSAYAMSWAYAPHVLIAGAFLYALAQIDNSVKAATPTVKRLRFIQLVGAFLLVVGGVLMLLGKRWIIALFIAALLQLYTDLRISSELKKESRP